MLKKKVLQGSQKGSWLDIPPYARCVVIWSQSTTSLEEVRFTVIIGDFFLTFYWFFQQTKVNSSLRKIVWYCYMAKFFDGVVPQNVKTHGLYVSDLMWIEATCGPLWKIIVASGSWNSSIFIVAEATKKKFKVAGCVGDSLIFEALCRSPGQILEYCDFVGVWSKDRSAWCGSKNDFG